MKTFQDHVAADLDAVFFNAPAKEFVTTHKIQGIRGIPSKAFDCEVVVDSERYLERAMQDKIEGISLNGLVFFIKKSEWIEKFNHIPKVGTALLFDGKHYQVIAVSEDMGSLEFTIEATRGA